MRVEDDGAVVTGNTFTSDDAIDEAIVVGTHYRTTALAEPVNQTTITGNTAAIAGSPNPYRWIWGHTDTIFADNTSLGRAVGLCEGVQPALRDDGRRRVAPRSGEPADGDPGTAVAGRAAAVPDDL